jgi:opacity protein-like surface antigen
MKKIMKSMAAAACVALMSLSAACSADKFDGVDPNGRPDANEIDATVTVDQETNTYTLTLNNKGYYPFWTVNVGRNPKTSTLNGFSKPAPIRSKSAWATATVCRKARKYMT